MDSVTVTNTGTSNLIISSVTSSNTLFTVTPTSGIIIPGSTQKYYVTFAPLTNGLKNGYIVFNHNAVNSMDSISVSGTGISSAFSVIPNYLNFGDVNDGLSKRDSVTVTNTGTSILIISSITSSNSLFTVTPIISTIQPGASRKFYVTFAPYADGPENGFIYFNHNAANVKDSIHVIGRGVSPKFSVSPLSINFGDVNNGTTKLDSVTVTNLGTADLIISSLTSSNSHFTVTELRATITPGSSQKFYIIFTPLTSGMHNGYIRFNFNATNAKDSIYLTGTGIGNPVFPIFSISPISLNFGEVVSGTRKTDSVTITNTGTANLVILDIISSNVFYAVTPHIVIIKAGDSQKFYVTFGPLINGLQNGYIYFYHNAASEKDSISVTGTGYGEDLSPKFSASYNKSGFRNSFYRFKETEKCNCNKHRSYRFDNFKRYFR